MKCNITKLFEIHNIKCNNDTINSIQDWNNYIKNKYILNNSYIIQHGSGHAYYNYNMKIKFYVTKDSSGTTISLHNENDEEKHICLMINVSKELGGNAEINSISNEGNCVSDNGIFKLNGTQLLNIAIDFIKQIKDKYDVKRIVLKDNSRKLCGKHNLWLPILHTLLYGNTWYGKYGFRPVSNKSDKVNIMDIYNNNKKIYRTAKVKDIKNLKKYIDEYFKIKVDKEEYVKIMDIYNRYETVHVFDFMRTLLDFKHCEFISYIYEKVFDDLGYINTTKDHLFYLDI